MAAGQWTIYATAKDRIGDGTMALGTGNFRMALFRTSASATITAISTRGLKSSVAAECSATGGYPTGGDVLPATSAGARWTVGTSVNQKKFTYATSGVIYTGNVNNIRYALIYKSASAGGGPVLCYAALSTTQFSIVSPNTLTVIPAATGVFTLA